MTIGWLYHEECRNHQPGAGHPERPERLPAVVEALERSGLSERMERAEFDRAELDALRSVHDPDYVETVRTAWDRGQRALDAGDTRISEGSYDAARRAAGGVLTACDRVMSGAWSRAFCSVRPPGHHAERDRALGFCLFNGIAIGAEHLIRQHGLERVAIVDFDVHHGNGTQHIFERRADVLYVSIHETPASLFPGTGEATEVGSGAGAGYTLNVPMPPGSGDEAYREAFERKVMPKVEGYEPQALLVSAGFDAAAEDPLAHMELTEAAFAWMTDRLIEAAEWHCGGRIVSVLEGGYDLTALGRDVCAHVRRLLEHDPADGAG